MTSPASPTSTNCARRSTWGASGHDTPGADHGHHRARLPRRALGGGPVVRQEEPMKYRYTDDQGQPLKECPECGHSLTNTGGILVVLSDGFNLSWQMLSFLDDLGDLVDPTGSIDAG